jgi:RimJ/RimL family protein N-acetyltransferase
MIFQEKIIKLKNGKECVLRSPDTCDAENILDYLKKASEETDYMIRYPEEVTMTIVEEEKFIKLLRESKKDLMISAFIDDKLVGNAGLSPIRDNIKVCHRASFGIAIKKEAWGLSLGKILLEEVLESAKKVGFEQVELEVVSENQKAINLYEKFGFKIYGTRENGFKLKNGSYYTEYLMMKTLK